MFERWGRRNLSLEVTPFLWWYREGAIPGKMKV